MKAVMKYPGSKWRIAGWIIEKFPEHHANTNLKYLP